MADTQTDDLQTEDDFLAAWQDRVAARNTENAHIAADEMLVAALRRLGWMRLADKWEAESQGWWWA